MKTKSPRRPLTGAALASATKQIKTNVEKLKTADKLVEDIKRLIYSNEGVAMGDLPDDPFVLQHALHDLVNFFLRSRDRDAETLAAEKSYRGKLVNEHSSQMAEATETINALKTTLRALLK